MTLQAILTLAMAVFALAIKPGAGMMTVMSRSLSQGLEACLTFILGICIVSIFFLLIVVFGFKYISVDMVFISILVKSLAAVYLIWLGIKGLQEDNSGLSIEEVEARNFFDNLMASIVLTLSNPLAILFYAGIIPTILDVQNITGQEVFVASLVIIIVESVVALAYSAPLIYWRSKVNMQWLNRMRLFSSYVIIVVGLYIGYTAIPAKELLAVF